MPCSGLILAESASPVKGLSVGFVVELRALAGASPQRTHGAARALAVRATKSEDQSRPVASEMGGLK
jgi:hypothetical protein